MTLQEQATAMVLAERERQDAKWGYPQNNTPFEWVSILTEEVGEFAQAVNDAYIRNAPTHEQIEQLRTEAKHVSAVAMSILEHSLREES